MAETMFETLIKSRCKDKKDEPAGFRFKRAHVKLDVSRKMFNMWLKKPEKIDKANLLLISKVYKVPVRTLANIYGCSSLTEKQVNELAKLK